MVYHVLFQQIPLSSIEECATPIPAASVIEHVDENDPFNYIFEDKL